MVTLQVSENTKIKLMKLAAKLQLKYGRKISIDEAIRYLFRLLRNEELLLSFYGCLKGEKIEEAQRLLKELRLEEEKRLEKLEEEIGI